MNSGVGEGVGEVVGSDVDDNEGGRLLVGLSVGPGVGDEGTRLYR